MVGDITQATRAQFLVYGTKTQVNVRPSGASSSARVADHVLNPSAPNSGGIVLGAAEGSGLLSLSLDSAYKVLATLERLESGLRRALDDGSTLAGDTSQPNYYSWQNTSVTSGTSNTSIGTYGTGDRTNEINVSTSYGLIASGVASNLVDGAYANDTVDAVTFTSGDVQGQWIAFDFGSPRVIHEATWNSWGDATQGDWVWQGSNDGNTFFSLGDSFALGGETAQVQDTLRHNTSGFQYYRLYGVSGTTDGNAQQDVTFKFTDEAPAPVTVARNLSAASLNVIDGELTQAKAAIDNLVSAAETFGVNLLSSASRAITLRTTPYGGALTIEAQPVDSRALGLTYARAESQADAEDAFAALQSALSNTRARISELRNYSTGLLAGQGTLSGEAAKNATAILPTGSLVDLLG